MCRSPSRSGGRPGFRRWLSGLITDPFQAEGYLAEGRCDLIALARELMWNPNWPVHAAQALRGGDPLSLLPPSYAWWLRRRDEVRTLYPTGLEKDLSLSALRAAGVEAPGRATQRIIAFDQFGHEIEEYRTILPA